MSETTVVPEWLQIELADAYSHLRAAVDALQEDAGPHNRFQLKREVTLMGLILKAIDPSPASLAQALVEMAESASDLAQTIDELTDATDATKARDAQ